MPSADPKRTLMRDRTDEQRSPVGRCGSETLVTWQEGPEWKSCAKPTRVHHNIR
jgi:hypothetical protein